MRRVAVVGLTLVVFGAGFVARQLQDDNRAPLPTSDELQADGFAVWPEDTLDEGMEACERPENWRLDPQDTAFQFAREVLDYPQPQLNTEPLIDEEGPEQQIRYLVGGPDTELGSVIDVRKFDRCWFVVNLEPREGGYLPSISFVHTRDRTRIVVSGLLVGTRIGYGSWEEEIAGSGSVRQVTLDPPRLAADATGSLMSISTSGKVNGGNAAPLVPIPPPATVPTTPLALEEVVQLPGICRRDDAYRHPDAALYDLFTFTFGGGVKGMHGRKVIYKPGNGAEHVGGDRWRLTLDGTELGARIPQIKKGCRRVLTINEDSPRILKSLLVDRDRLSFDLDWGSATSGTLTVSTSRAGNRWTFQKIQDPLTVQTYEEGLLDEPLEVTVILRKGRRIISAQREWYRPDV